MRRRRGERGRHAARSAPSRRVQPPSASRRAAWRQQRARRGGSRHKRRLQLSCKPDGKAAGSRQTAAQPQPASLARSPVEGDGEALLERLLLVAGGHNLGRLLRLCRGVGCCGSASARCGARRPHAAAASDAPLGAMVSHEEREKKDGTIMSVHAPALSSPSSYRLTMPGGSRSQHNKGHKTGKHAPKGQRHKQREAKAALPGAKPARGGGDTSRKASRLLAAKQQRASKRAEVLNARRAASAAPKARALSRPPPPSRHAGSSGCCCTRGGGGGARLGALSKPQPPPRASARFEAALGHPSCPAAVKTFVPHPNPSAGRAVGRTHKWRPLIIFWRSFLSHSLTHSPPFAAGAGAHAVADGRRRAASVRGAAV